MCIYLACIGCKYCKHVCRHCISIIRDVRYTFEVGQSLQMEGYGVLALPPEGNLWGHQHCWWPSRLWIPPNGATSSSESRGASEFRHGSCSPTRMGGTFIHRLSAARAMRTSRSSRRGFPRRIRGPPLGTFCIHLSLSIYPSIYLLYFYLSLPFPLVLVSLSVSLHGFH